MTRILSILLLLAWPVGAANYCVGPAATGSGSGADWNNLKAWTSTPARGDVWYLVNGSYAFKTLSTANSGTTRITIKKATASNYTEVSATGWSSGYAAQASFAGFTIGSSYWLIDGVTGDGASVMPADITTSRYGFYVTANSHPIALTGSLTDITIKHTRFYTAIAGGTGIYQADVKTGDKNNVTISYCLFDGFNEMIRNGTDTWNNTVLEYSVILNSQGSASFHGNAINSMWAPLVNMTIRYNVFKDMVGDGISGMISGNNSSLGPILCYGNVFDNIPHCTYIIGANSGYSINNSTFYNNTVIHCDNDDAGFAICGRTSGSGNVGGNNLCYDLISYLYNSAWSGDYDSFYSCAIAQGANKHTATGNPFVDYANMDYRLVANTPSGTSLVTEYATDALGNLRTSWTRGAFEFDGVPGSNAVLVVSSWTPVACLVGATTNVTVAITNTGTAAVTNTASISPPFWITNATYTVGIGASTNLIFTFAPTQKAVSSATATIGSGATLNVSGIGYTNTSWPLLATNHYFASPWSENASGRITHSTSPSGPASAGLALLGFTVTNAGDYYLWMVAVAPDGAKNSGWINVDAEPTGDTMAFHAPISTVESNMVVNWQGAGTFDNVEFPTNVWTLAAGAHQLFVRGREAGFQIYSVTPVLLVTNPPVNPPTWVLQPINTLATNGTWVNLYSVALNATGYQWRHQGTNVVASDNIVGPNALSLAFMTVDDTNAGSYVVVATNAGGSITSSVALLTVTNTSVAPVITQSPASLKVRPAQSVTLTAEASGTAPMEYWWYRNGTNIASGSTLSIEAANSTSIGSYYCVVDNSAGSVTSSIVTLDWLRIANCAVLRVGQ